MDSSLISKVEKAREYATRTDAFTFDDFAVQFHGTHREHTVRFTRNGGFHCDCEYSHNHSACSHIMALERILAPLLPPARGN